MSRTRTLTNLILDCRQRTGMENSDFCSDTEITEYINQEIAELHTALDQYIGPGYLRSSTTVNVLGNGTNTYSLGATVWRVISMQGAIGSRHFNVLNFMESERPQLQNSGAFDFDYPAMYRIVGSNIEIQPDVTAFTLTVRFVPAPTRLSAGSDTFDGYAGFEMAVIYGVCATMLAKEESDPSFFIAQKDRIMNHIKDVGATRDAANPERVQDVVGLDWWYY